MNDAALLELLRMLRARGYHFTTVTPASHARVLARTPGRRARSIEDALGWSLPFDAGALDPEIVDLLRRADALEPAGEGTRSKLRVSSLGGDLYLHSAYPTEAEDSVFFGPDSYRFADLITAELGGCAGTLVDIGTGSGVGAIVAGKLCPDARVVMTDVNPLALRLAALNARAGGVAAQALLADDLSGLGPIQIALANPPYIIDDAGRAYRDGGGMLGAEIAFDMARMAMARLAPGGRLILYTGSAIVDGHDALRAALEGLGGTLRYRELDPDVFGEELARPVYAGVDRIALVAAVLSR